MVMHDIFRIEPRSQGRAGSPAGNVTAGEFELRKLIERECAAKA